MGVLALWALTHEYRGLVYDGQIYAVQALAKLRPSLNADLFLQHGSQDRFTVFPRAYAWLISCIGLNAAAFSLMSLCTIWLLYAAWNLTAQLFDRDCAWLTILLLLVTGGHYGAFGVFNFLEPYVTARSAAEALIVTSLAVYLRGLVRLGLLLATGALFVHPLMALPGWLLLICLRLPFGMSLAAAITGVLSCLAVAVGASRLAAMTTLLPLMDPPWVDVVRERSQFLFLQLWTLRDWELNARPFICLALTLMTLQNARTARLAMGAMLVGATGLLIAAIACRIGPVALLMQGQAWRWMWITTFVSVVLLLPTARHLWHQGTWGRLCAVSLVAGWSFPADVGFFYALFALLAWSLRRLRWLRSDRVYRWAAAAIGGSLIVLTVVDTRAAAALPSHPPLHPQATQSALRAVFTVKIWCIALASALWYGVRKSQSRTARMGVACALAAGAAFLVHEPFVHSKSYGSVADMNEFADWRALIPAASTVFVTDGHDSGSFVWFTLQRNNYLSPGQSAGVVFSRATALEVERRSDVLLPLMDPNWKILTASRRAASGTPDSLFANHRPLTPESLLAVCSDPALGFVISPENVGFAPSRHTHTGAYQNWNLYDCNRARAERPMSAPVPLS